MDLVESMLSLARTNRYAADDEDGWWGEYRKQWASRDGPFDAAAICASKQDRLAWVVASAYTAALDHVAPAGSLRRSLCVTEDSGNDPKTIETKLDTKNNRLTGTKSFATLGGSAEQFLVLADRGHPEDGWKDLVVVGVQASARGVTVRPGPRTPFTPELSHARVTFSRAPVDSIIESSGWHAFVKPFRLVEDAFVLGAVTAWLLRLARWSGQVDVAHRLLAVFLAVNAVTEYSPRSRAAEIAYAGVRKLFTETIERIDWTLIDAGTAERWRRDRAILDVASGVHEARTTLADRHFDLANASVVREWRWSRDEGRWSGWAIVFDDGWLKWNESEARPRGSASIEEQTIAQFRSEGAPGWVPERIASDVTRYLEEE